MAKVSNSEANAVLNALLEQHSAAIAAGYSEPKLEMDSESEYADVCISWEEGPYEWAYTFPHGGIDPEFGFAVKDVSDMIPTGIWCETIYGWGLIGIYRD